MSLRDPLGLVGQVLHGQFRVDELVDDGKRSLLYRGQHLMLEVPIAVKVMKAPPGASGEAFIRRFRHESRLHYRLSQASPFVVRVLASGTAVAPSTGGLSPFMVLEWLDGHSLAHDFRERRARGEQGRPLREAIRLLDPAVEAIAFAHAHGIAHREITPEHLFLAQTPDGPRLKVLDFGVAKILSERALDIAPASQSMGLVPIGSPIYAAPEQYSASAGAVGTWTDVYAIALVLLEALRDRPAFDDGPIPLGLRVLDPAHRPTPRALGIAMGPYADAVIAKAVAVMVAERPADAGEFWGMLKNAVARDEEEATQARAPLPRVSELPPSTALPMQLVQAAIEPPTISYEPATDVRPRAAAARLAGADTAGPPTIRDPMPLGAMAVAYDDLGPPTLEPHTRDPPTREREPPSTVPRPGLGGPTSERTVVMPVDEIKRMNEMDVDESEPVPNRAELFVGREDAPPGTVPFPRAVSARAAPPLAATLGVAEAPAGVVPAPAPVAAAPPAPAPTPAPAAGRPVTSPGPTPALTSSAAHAALQLPQSQIRTIPPQALRAPAAARAGYASASAKSAPTVKVRQGGGLRAFLLALVVILLAGIASGSLYLAWRIKAGKSLR